MKNIRVFLPENFPFLEVKFSLYLNRRVFVMNKKNSLKYHLNICFLELSDKFTILGLKIEFESCTVTGASMNKSLKYYRR